MNYSQDVLLHFMNNVADGDDDGFVAKASDFLGMEIASTTSVKLSFRGSKDNSGVNTATIGVADLEHGYDSLNADERENPTFRDICTVVTSLLNSDRDKYFVVADQAAGVYVRPFSGTVAVANAAD